MVGGKGCPLPVPLPCRSRKPRLPRQSGDPCPEGLLPLLLLLLLLLMTMLLPQPHLEVVALVIG